MWVANPARYPTDQIRGAPERDPGHPHTRGWSVQRTAAEGIGLVDPGTNLEADVGDVAYAVATIEKA